MKSNLKELDVPEFKSYEEEAAFWDQIDTADYMPDDDQWIHFDTPNQRAVRVAILPEIAKKLYGEAKLRGVSIETIVNVLLSEHVYQTTVPMPSIN